MTVWTYQAPKIQPFGNLSLSPSTLVFHYALECFEGMKCYKGVDGGIRLFRPDLNIARFNRSSDRLALPTVDPKEFQKCLEDLVKLDADWIPEGRGCVTLPLSLPPLPSLPSIFEAPLGEGG